ncbi:MAG: hypothetical protein GX242_06100 [Clostridiales bacterium]|nr:hypothetical protein [Clostridiales bacterium]
MKKKILLIFTFIMVLALSMTIVACVDYEKDTDPVEETDTVSRTMLITNGTFYDASSTTKGAYVKNSVTGWTATKGSIATTATGVTMGVVDLADKELFDANSDIHSTVSSAFAYPGVDPKTPFDTDDFGKPTTELQDTNALLISSVETAGSIYYKNSASFTLEANKYYLLQYSVCTNIESNEDNKADKGAWVTISGGVSYQDAVINTNGKWETRYLYIESNKYSSKTIDINLWLGHGPETISSVPNKYIVKGAALFDNIICKEVTKDKDGETVFNHDTFTAAAQSNANKAYGYESCYFLSDTKLEQSTDAAPTSSNAKNFFYSFREGIYSSSNVSNYSLIKGKSGLSSADQPTVNTPHTGIVDLSKLYKKEEDKEAVDTYFELLKGVSYSTSWKTVSYENWKNNLVGDNGGRENMSSLDEKKALMIHHGDLSGAGFKSNSALVIKSNTYYVISVWAFVNPLNDLPTTNKPSSPTEYTDIQKAYLDAINNAYNADIDYGFYENYFTELTEEEKAKIMGETAIYDPENQSDNVITFLATESDRFEYSKDIEFLGYEKEVYQAFKYYYLWKELKDVDDDPLIDSTVKAYLEFQMLTERNNFINKDYKTLTDLEDSWQDYYDKLGEYMAKYNAWKSATSGTDLNQKPYAHVKLTGAGDDIVEQTSKLGQWEQITFYIQGNQLSDRKLNIEFWFGEGASTDYTTLMMGSVFFDNISITEYHAGSQPNYDWQTLNQIESADELAYGGLTNDMDAETFQENYWALKLESNDVASADLKSVSFTREILPDGQFADLSDLGITSYAQLIFKNSVATASVLTSKEFITINPNTAYRIAMLVKTADIKDGLGVDISLLGGDDKDDLTASIASVTTINDSEWQEVVFYVLGDVIKTNYVTLKLQLGSGTRFSTEKYIKGQVHLALINVTEIKYSEFSSTSKSGDLVKDYTFSNTEKPSDSVTNGSFSGIDLAATNETEFGEGGIISGTAVTSNWTGGTVKNNIFTAPVVSMANDIATWEKVYGVSYTGDDEVEPEYYEVWVRYKDADNKYQEKYVASVLASDTLAFNASDIYKDLTVNYKVRAVGKSNSELSYYDVVSSFSNYSGEVLGSEEGEYDTVDDYIAAKPPAKPELKYQAGTVVIDKETDFADSTGSYVSPYDTMLKISSNYALSHTLTSSSATLSANTYYKVSVWVKTEDGAKASVTLKDVSDVLSAKSVTGKYIGFTNIDTQGKWVQYAFYIKMGNNSGTLSMQLSLGDAYVNKVSKKSTNVKTDATVYDATGLSSGSAYFDNVELIAIEEEEYKNAAQKEELTNGVDNLYDFEIGDIIPDYEGIEYKIYTNKFALRILESVIDSFDSFKENTIEEGKEGYNLGHTPNNYTWSKADSYTSTSEDDRVYGVYSQSDALSKLEMIYKKYDDNDDLINAFSGISNFPENFDITRFIAIDGSNSLVMSNKELFAQSYKVNNTSTINADGYYKITFKAKTLIAAKAFDDNGDAILDENGDITYTIENVNAEFRFMPTTDTDKYQSIYINSNGKVDSIYDTVEYTMYIYNPSSTSATANWSFVLGAESAGDDKTGSMQPILGMLIIDQVGMVEIDKDEYEAVRESADFENWTDEQKISSAMAFYSYDEDKKEDPVEEPDDEPDQEPEEKPSVWSRGEVWLLVSSLIIAVVIIVVIVVLLIRRWKKKHPKKVVGENILKAEKDIKVIEPEQQQKEDFIIDEDYTDDKPKYVQRVVPKKKKSKNKGKR